MDASACGDFCHGKELKMKAYRRFQYRMLGQEKEFVPMKPVPEKKSYGILGIVALAAAFFYFLPHGIFGKRK